MKTYESQDIRNFGLIGHKASGKTSIAESALWCAKETNRLGNTSDGTSVLDFEDEEKSRVMSIHPSFASFAWNKHKINLIDTPGDGNFLAETRLTMQAMDAAVCVVSAKDGVEPMTERVFSWAAAQGLARAIFISKVDVENANLTKAMADVKENLCKQATLLQIPIGQESNFKGIVDLLSEKAYLFKAGDSGEFEEGEIPADFKDAVEEARNALIEDIATIDEALMEKYFEGELTTDEIVVGLSKAMAEGAIVPVLCGSGLLNQGVAQLLDFAIANFPDPTKREPRSGKLNGDATSLAADPAGPFACHVVKTMVDQHAGRISICQVLSGQATTNLDVKNDKRDGSERIGALNRIVGKKLEGVDVVNMGDIFAVAKLKDTLSGDTLSVDGWVADTVQLPPPLISRGIIARDKGAEDKIAGALRRLTDEDAGLHVGRDDRTGELLLSGTGGQHIEVSAEKMGRKFGVACDLKIPRIPYLETITAAVKGVEGKHKKQTGGSGQFAVCYFDLMPGERGAGLEFLDEIVGGSIPKQWIPSVEKGINKAMARGFVAGYPLIDVRVRLYDGKYHAVDSSDTAFQTAGSKGMKSAISKAKPALLEPIMDMEITIPEENMGDVMGDVNTRRGRVMGSESQGKYVVIKAQMPLAEVQTYEATLRAITQGRGSFTMEHSHMDQVPANIMEKVIKDSGFVDADDDD